MGKKQEILMQLFQDCKAKGSWEFDNEKVRELSHQADFKNLHEVTKIDNTNVLPDVMKNKEGWYIIHLGEGKHMFRSDLDKGFHRFEEVPEENVIPWRYRKSLLNTLDTSESTALSVGFNQRIIHDFLYEDIVASPKMYNSRRTKVSAEYHIAGDKIQVNKLQVEMDMVCELMGKITVFEAKNGFPDDFAIYQLFHPYLYYRYLIEQKKIPEDTNVNYCYLLKGEVKRQPVLRIFLYDFKLPEPPSIKLLKCAEYRLLER